MSPSFVFDKNGRIRLIGGASGGPRIITATAQVILNYIGKGWDLLKCVKSPRVHSQLLPDTVYIENNTNLYYATILGSSIENIASVAYPVCLNATFDPAHILANYCAIIHT